MKKRYFLLIIINFLLIQSLCSQNVGIGISVPASKLHVKGSADVSQLIIDANSTQGNTQPIIKLRNSSGNDLLWIHSDDSANLFMGINAGRMNNVAGGGMNNTFVGSNAGYTNSTGYNNTANGHAALFSNSTGYNNTAVGKSALFSNNTGSQNTATGTFALQTNQSGINNTANGFQALSGNTSGIANSATGSNALRLNTIGNFNTASGTESLFFNTSGSNNSATGWQALFKNTSGNNNTSSGSSALKENTTGYLNSATGFESLYANTTGNANTGNGSSSLRLTSSGIYNTACGHSALYSNTTGNNNTAMGYYAGGNKPATTSNHTAIGYYAGWIAGNSNEIEIGNTSVTWIGGNVGWGTYSDKRIKDNIQSNVPGLSFITKLKPVTYKLNIHRQNEMCGIIETAQVEGINDKKTVELDGKYDIEKITQSGFLAQEVEEAAFACNYDFNGVKAPTGNAKLYRLQYAEFVVPLVKAVQEQQQMIGIMQKEIRLLKEQNKMLQQLLVIKK